MSSFGRLSALAALLLAVEPATAQSGSEEHYWLKGKMFSPDQSECGYDCPSGNGLLVIVQANDAYGSRRTGGIFAGEFGFGPPMAAGINWRVDIPQQPDFYECVISRGSSGTVIADERATNVAGALHVTDITCRLNADGRREWKRLADIRNPPHRTLDRDYLIGRWSSSAGCSATIEFRSDGGFVLPFGTGTWQLDGDRVTFNFNGTAQTGQYWVIDDRTMGHIADGKKGQSVRC